MAKYTATTAVHKTLTATTVDVVTLTSVATGVGVEEPSVTVVNRTGSAEIYFTVTATGTDPAEPTVKGANTYVVPAAISTVTKAVSTSVAGHPVVVKLISTGAEEYSVEAL